MIKAFLQRLRAEEDGAVTVDFVVLTAAICIGGVTMVNAFDDATLEITNDIVATMESASPP